MSFTTNIPSSIGANEWTQQHTERQQTERPLDKILAMSLEQDDMDRYITRQQSDDNTGQCFDENWEATNTINWKITTICDVASGSRSRRHNTITRCRKNERNNKQCSTYD